MHDNQFLIPIETFIKRMGISNPDRIYWKLLEYTYGIQPATESEWYARLERLKKE